MINATNTKAMIVRFIMVWSICFLHPSRREKQIDRHMHIGASYVCAPEQTNPYHKKAGEFLCDRTGFSHYIAGKNLPKNAYKHRYHQYHQYIGNCFIDRFPHGYFIMVERI